MLRPLAAAAFILVACGGSASTSAATAPTSATSSASPTISSGEILAGACGTYQNFVTYATHDIRQGTRSDSEIVKQLTEYQDSLENDAHTLTDACLSTSAHVTLATADAIGHLKNSIDSFGLYSQITVSAITTAGKAGQRLLAYC